MTERQVKSKARVADHGEVFTNEREVNAMLDLVKQETERIDSRFLEPACGDGNFLAEILRRKLTVVERVSHNTKFNRKALSTTVLKSINTQTYQRNAFIAVTSIYGVELLQDNVDECIDRLFGIWDEAYTSICKKDANDECRKAVRYVLEHNILCGNALTLKKVDAQGNDTDEPIVFAEWEMVMDDLVKRRDYRLDVLMADSGQPASLLPDDPNNAANWKEYENDRIAQPLREYPMTDYRKVHENG